MKQLPWILIAALSIALMFSITQNVQTSDYHNVYTDSLVFRDTMPFYIPVPRDSVVLRYKYITVPAATSDSTISDIKVESTPDSTKLSIPITQRMYETETFKAWVSGYDPKLDSCLVFPKTTMITNIQQPKMKRWGLGVHVGWGVCGNQSGPYVGIGVSYNLFAW